MSLAPWSIVAPVQFYRTWAWSSAQRTIYAGSRRRPSPASLFPIPTRCRDLFLISNWILLTLLPSMTRYVLRRLPRALAVRLFKRTNSRTIPPFSLNKTRSNSTFSCSCLPTLLLKRSCLLLYPIDRGMRRKRRVYSPLFFLFGAIHNPQSLLLISSC